MRIQMKKAFLVTIVLYLTMTSSLYGLEMIDESSIESLRSMPYEEYDSGYGLWDSADLELFVSKDENFSIGLWKSKAGSEEIDTPYPYNVFFLIKSGEIKTKTKEGDTNRFVSGEGFLIPKGWMGTFDISKDVEAIYFYDGLVETMNDSMRNIYEDAALPL
jgi:Predicted enzyme of the cupin superfamily